LECILSFCFIIVVAVVINSLCHLLPDNLQLQALLQEDPYPVVSRDEGFTFVDTTGRHLSFAVVVVGSSLDL